MESLPLEINTYHLIVTRQDASEILLSPCGSGWAIPSVEIHPHHRLAEQLTQEADRALGVEAYCLLIPELSNRGRDGKAKCAVLESVRQTDNTASGARWFPGVEVEHHIEASEAQLVQDAIEELSTYATNKEAGSFARPGWLAELLSWTQEQLSPLGLRLTGAFHQLNASPTFSLIRLETDGGAVWFKATGEPNSHELHVTVALAKHFPHYVPQILSVHHRWNGWLSTEVPCISLDRTGDFPAWRRAAEELAELQIASIGKTTELLEAVGLRDLRLPNLAEQIGPFLARVSELMTAQEKLTPAPLIESEIRSLAEELKQSCALLESFHLPNTLGHLDFNPGNVLVSEQGCVFLDWAEGCITNPLLTFEYLREHMVRREIEAPAASECLSAAYLRPWASFCSPEELRRALTLSPIVAVFAYALASDSWRSPDLVRDPKRSGYFRSLTRRMYREAVRTAERSELCLS